MATGDVLAAVLMIWGSTFRRPIALVNLALVCFSRLYRGLYCAITKDVTARPVFIVDAEAPIWIALCHCPEPGGGAKTTMKTVILRGSGTQLSEDRSAPADGRLAVSQFSFTSWKVMLRRV